MKLVNFLAELPRPLVTSLALMICVLVGVADVMNGPEYTLVPFYLVPVILTAWFVGRKTGYFLSCASALVWLMADMAMKSNYPFGIAMYWNDLMELTLFLLTALIVSALKGVLEREKGIARTDHLTGIPNRRSFYEFVSTEMKRNLRYEVPFTVAYLDIDNFKAVNDSVGHAKGDELLKSVAAIITTAIRETDTVARLGGDEFALLLPETAGESAEIVAAKIRHQLKDIVECNWPITFSMGMVTFLKSPPTIDEVIGYADHLMYQVKEGGKNALRCEDVGA
jgi:diguanylate cyclase (GGDEF)-like protein